MLQQSPPAQLREELMVRLRAEAQLGGNNTLAELERHLELHKEKLKTYQQILPRTLLKRTKLTVPYIFIK